LFINDFS